MAWARAGVERGRGPGNTRLPGAGAPTALPASNARQQTVYMAGTRTPAASAQYVVVARDRSGRRDCGAPDRQAGGRERRRQCQQARIPRRRWRPDGTYYVQVYAQYGSGTSALSNEIVVHAPKYGTGGVRTPNAASGSSPGSSTGPRAQAGAGPLPRHCDSDEVRSRCPVRPGLPGRRHRSAKVTSDNRLTPSNILSSPTSAIISISASATTPNPPARTHRSPATRSRSTGAAMRRRVAERVSDLNCAGHCTFSRESRDYRPFFNEYGRLTAAGAF